MITHNSITYAGFSWILIEKGTGKPKLNADKTVELYTTFDQANASVEEFKTLGYYFQAVPVK
jgi:hypothetical protein